jgi:hypothetical protein
MVNHLKDFPINFIFFKFLAFLILYHYNYIIIKKKFPLKLIKKL